MKILYVTTVASTMPFFKSIIRELVDMGNQVDIACNQEKDTLKTYFHDWGCNYIPLMCERNPLKLGNLKAIKQIQQAVRSNHYDAVHCHTPIAAACTRIALRKIRKAGVKVIYTAHGFHFYEGAPLINWLIYYPIEWICSWWTDVLITINKEDYQRAKKKFHAKETKYIPGVGIDVEKIQAVQVDREKKREELGIGKDDFLLLSVGELNKNKNHEVVIRAIAELKNPKIKYAICGKGPLKEYLEELAEKLGVRNQLFLLGFRTDVIEICKSADVFVFPSKREGLGLAALEAMASGLPLITSNRHGIMDYSVNGVTGFNCEPNSVKGFSYGINELWKNDSFRCKTGMNNFRKAYQYDIHKINTGMKEIYRAINMRSD